MDAKDAEGRIPGSAAIGREPHGRRKFAALLFIHSLLTGACMVLTLYSANKPAEEPPMPGYMVDRGIYLNKKSGSDKSSSLLHFTVTWKNGMELNQESKVNVTFPGPYIFYIRFRLCGDDGSTGTLTMHQGEYNTTIELEATKNCTSFLRHEKLVSLSEKDVVTFSFKENNVFLQALRVGLHYMLGAQHFETPL